MDTPQKDHPEAPTTIREVGIHVAYLREDIAGIKALMEQMPSNFASKSDVADHEIRLRSQEKFNAELKGAQDNQKRNYVIANLVIGLAVAILYYMQLNQHH